MPLDVERIRERLPGRRIGWFATTPSTMTEAARLAAAGEPGGTLVLAEEQTAGKGRQGRNWHSEAESGLYVSVILRLPLSSREAPILTLALGLAVAEAVARAADYGCDLRWPNDLLASGKKCAGILVQLENNAFIAGIGINVNHREFPPEIAHLATSLYLATGKRHSREDLVVELASAVDRFTKMLVEGGREPVLRMFSRASSYVQGRRVIVDQPDGLLEGVTDGLDPAGFLFVRRDDGSRSLVLAGGVRPVE